MEGIWVEPTLVGEAKIRPSRYPQNILYNATLTSSNKNEEPRIYKGIYKTTFKQQYTNHKKSFNFKSYRKDTDFSIKMGN